MDEIKGAILDNRGAFILCDNTRRVPWLIAGIISAVRHYTWSDVSIMIVALFGLSMPNFWFGLMLIQWFAIGPEWMPEFMKMRAIRMGR